jgi:hypothetical protein
VAREKLMVRKVQGKMVYRKDIEGIHAPRREAAAKRRRA